MSSGYESPACGAAPRRRAPHCHSPRRATGAKEAALVAALVAAGGSALRRRCRGVHCLEEALTTTSPANPRPEVFDLLAPGLALEFGARVDRMAARVWFWSSAAEHERLAALRVDAGPVERVRRSAQSLAALQAPGDGVRLVDDRPTVLVVHALTGDMCVGGDGGWWEPLVGPGKVLDPERYRLLCVNNLGSCYGTSGPGDEVFPMLAENADMPAPITTWDQAQAILGVLDALGVGRVELVVGGSVGGMVSLCLCALAPERFARVMPVAACEAASPWIIGWNHIARSVLLDDPTYPHDARYGLVTARALAMLTYRAERGLQQRHGRQVATEDQRRERTWWGRQPYAVQTYLDYQGDKLYQRYDARAYISQLDAMDHHDIARVPDHLVGDRPEDWTEDAAQVLSSLPERSWGLSRMRASLLAVGIDTDELFLPEHSELLVRRYRSLGRHAELAMIRSAHGHDAFLIEADQMEAILARGLALPPGAD